jgi:hypothetical protein
MKHCQWCDNAFEPNVSYQIYCSPECRESATREKIAERYAIQRLSKKSRKNRKCKSCGCTLSVYNDTQTCTACEINPSDVSKILKEIKGIADGKIELD